MTKRINKIRGLKSLKDVPYFSDYLIRRGEGSSIKSTRDNNALVGFVFAKGNTYNDIERSLKQMTGKIEIVVRD